MTFRPAEHEYLNIGILQKLAVLSREEFTEPGAWWLSKSVTEPLSAAANMSGTTLGNLREPNRHNEAVLRRMHFCYLLTKRGWTPGGLAKVLRCDRSSVSYALRRYAQLRSMMEFEQCLTA